MGRPIPSSQSISLPLSLPLFAATMCASVAIFITLCVSHHRKPSRSPKSQPSSPKRQPTSRSLHSLTSDKSTKKIKAFSEPIPAPSSSPYLPPQPIQDQEDSRRSPPLVLDESLHGAIAPISPVNRSSSRRRLSASLSMRFSGGLSKIRTSNKKKVEEEEVKVEEQSVWMKTIILGERCKVPSDDEGEVVIKDEKGNKKRNYHPKTPRSLPVSRTNSFVSSET